MAPGAVPMTPGLTSFLKSIKSRPVETSIENLISYGCVPPETCGELTGVVFLRDAKSEVQDHVLLLQLTLCAVLWQRTKSMTLEG